MDESLISPILWAYEKTGFTYQQAPSISLDLISGGPLAVLAVFQKGPDFFRNKRVKCREKCCFRTRGPYFENWELNKWVPFHQVGKPIFWKGFRTAVVWCCSKIYNPDAKPGEDVYPWRFREVEDLDYIQEAKGSWDFSKEVSAWLERVCNGENWPQPACIQQVKDSFYEGLDVGRRLHEIILKRLDLRSDYRAVLGHADPIEKLELRKIEPMDNSYFDWLRGEYVEHS